MGSDGRKMATVGDDFWYVLPDGPYRVGRNGSVWRFFHGRGGKNPRWKPRKVDKVGRVRLCVCNEPTEVSVAQLVLEAFGSPQPPGHEPQHDPDPDLRNNAIENLRWVPHGTNMIGHHALVEAGKKRDPHRALTDDEALEAIRLASAGETITSIAARFGVANSTIERILYNKTYRHLEQPPSTSGRYRRGQAHYAATLTPEKIEAAARLRKEGRTLEEIGAVLGCKASTVSRALSGVTWKHLHRCSDDGSGPRDHR